MSRCALHVLSPKHRLSELFCRAAAWVRRQERRAPHVGPASLDIMGLSPMWDTCLCVCLQVVPSLGQVKVLHRRLAVAAGSGWDAREAPTFPQLAQRWAAAHKGKAFTDQVCGARGMGLESQAGCILARRSNPVLPRHLLHACGDSVLLVCC